MIFRYFLEMLMKSQETPREIIKKTFKKKLLKDLAFWIHKKYHQKIIHANHKKIILKS